MAFGTRNAVMVIDKIPGDAKIQTRQGADKIDAGIWIHSVAMTTAQVGASDSAGANAAARRSQVRISTVDIEKPVDGATTSLFNSLTTARVFPEWKIYLLRAGGDGTMNLFVRWTLSGARVREQRIVTEAQSGGIVVPVEHLKIAFSKIQISYLDEAWVPGSSRGEFNSSIWNVDEHLAE